MSTPPSGPVAAERLLTSDVGALPLQPLPLQPTDVVAGEPVAAVGALSHLAGAEVGVWELTPGVVTDVEDDEVFAVLAGRGTVTFSDGSSLALRPGVVVRLRSGDRTTWDITETLRKFYVA